MHMIRQLPFQAILVAASLLLLAPFISQAQTSNDTELLDRSAKAFSRVVKDVRPAVVHIAVTSTVDTSTEYKRFSNHPFLKGFLGPTFRFPIPIDRTRN